MAAYKSTLAVSPLAAIHLDSDAAERYHAMAVWLRIVPQGRVSFVSEDHNVLPTTVYFDNIDDWLLYELTWRSQ